MKKYLLFFVLLLATTSASIPLPTHAEARPPMTVEILKQDGSLLSFFSVDTANLAGGAKVAAGDLGDDGKPEIVLGNGLGNEPRVSVYRVDGSLIGSFLAYDPTMGLGINVAICDVDGDGINEILTGTQYGAGPHVRTFNNLGIAKDNGGFMAYDSAFRGGVNISCGDLDADGKAELITSAGPTGGPEIKTWKFVNNVWTRDQDFFAFAPEETSGVVTTVANGKLFAALQNTPNNRVIKSYVIHSSVMDDAAQENHTIGTSGLFSINEIILATATTGGYIADDVIAFATNVAYGAVSATATDVNSDGIQEIIAVPDRPLFGSSTDAKSIIIDIGDQRLYAYENGVLANTFLISSAKAPFETPLAQTSVLAKIPYVDYTWSYGANDPRNYSLGLVQYNLRIFTHIYIHYAYWHNNFGYPMSHGCVNVNLTNMHWIYDWSDVGIPVTTQA